MLEIRNTPEGEGGVVPCAQCWAVAQGLSAAAWWPWAWAVAMGIVRMLPLCARGLRQLPPRAEASLFPLAGAARRLLLCPRGVPARRCGGRCVTASAAAAGGVSDPPHALLHAGAHGPATQVLAYGSSE